MLQKERRLNMAKKRLSGRLDPKLIREWHSSKNRDLVPTDVTPKSNRKAWWVCEKGHEWEAVIASRTSGRGCPYCSGNRVGDDNSLAVLNKDIAKQWHPTKNGDVSASDFRPGSHKRVWWLCEKGHEWQAVIKSRTSGRGCQECWKDRRASLVRNPPLERSSLLQKPLLERSLANLDKGISRGWHPTKNGTLTPADFTPGSNRKVWWVCERGHDYPATIKSRTKGTGCPKCSNQTSRREIAILCELQSLFSDVRWREDIEEREECDIYVHDYRIGIEVDGLYWHKEKTQRELDKNAVLESLGITLYRIRDRGLKAISANDKDIFVGTQDSHLSVIRKLLNRMSQNDCLSGKDRNRIADYLNHNRLVNMKEYRRLLSFLPGPPPEKSLLHTHPAISKEWHPSQNAPLLPSLFPSKSNKKVWWQCKKGHEWEAAIYDRTNGTGCPYCAGKKVCDANSLAVLNGELAKQWHPTKNTGLSPTDITPGSNKKVWWQCEKDHEWQAAICDRTSGHGCQECWKDRRASLVRKPLSEKSLAFLHEDVSSEWHPKKNGQLTSADFTPGSHRKVWWLCEKGHEWQAVISSRTSGRGCPYCAGKKVGYGNSFGDIEKEIAKQLHPTKNGDFSPYEVRPGSHKKVWWLCHNGHEWEAVIKERTYGTGCPHCWREKGKKANKLIDSQTRQDYMAT